MKKLENLMVEAESTTTTSSGGSAPPPAAPTPAAAPAKSDADAPPASVEGDDWSGDLSADDEGNAAPSGKPAKPAMKAPPAVKPAVEAPRPAAAPAAATPPAAAPAAPKPGEAPPVAPPAAQPPATPPAAAAPAAKPGEAPPAAPETPEAKAARQKAERDASEKQLNDQLVEYYKIPDEWAAKLATEPELVLPQLAARLHQAVLQSVRGLLDTGVPQVVNGLMQFQQREASAKKAFYDRWPTLAPYEAQVLQAATLFAQLNPKATPEERIERIGKIVSESLGISVAPMSGAPAGIPSVPVHSPAAFKPAGGGAAAGARPPASSNEFEAIAEELVASGE